MAEQTALFDFSPPLARERLQPVERPCQTAANINGRTLDDYAFLYTGTEKGNFSTIHFMMTVEDAMAWCSSNLSKGVVMGTEWAYFWTRVSTFLACPWGDEHLHLHGLTDNGKWDEKIASLGLKKISIAEIPSILKPFGVKIKE